MNDNQKKKLSELIKSYCKLAGLDQNEFINNCKAEFGKDEIAFSKGVLDLVKSDQKTMQLADTINWLSSFSETDIPSVAETNKVIDEHLPPFDKELFNKVIQKDNGV